MKRTPSNSALSVFTLSVAGRVAVAAEEVREGTLLVTAVPSGALEAPSMLAELPTSPGREDMKRRYR
jgi:hypothetical protein